MIDKADAEKAKYFNKEFINKVTSKLIRYYSDPDKKERKADGLCKCCYYYMYDRVGGCAITIKNCECCGEEMSFGSTATDKYCLKCAKENKSRNRPKFLLLCLLQPVLTDGEPFKRQAQKNWFF